MFGSPECIYSAKQTSWVLCLLNWSCFFFFFYLYGTSPEGNTWTIWDNLVFNVKAELQQTSASGMQFKDMEYRWSAFSPCGSYNPHGRRPRRAARAWTCHLEGYALHSQYQPKVTGWCCMSTLTNATLNSSVPTHSLFSKKTACIITEMCLLWALHMHCEKKTTQLFPSVISLKVILLNDRFILHIKCNKTVKNAYC